MSRRPSPSADLSAQSLFDAGYQRLHADDSVGARAAFRLAVVAEPAMADAYGMLAETETCPDDAVKAYERALRLEPGRWSWRLGRANALTAAGRDSVALLAFQELLEERPDSAPVRHGYGRALVRAGRPEDAVVELREALMLRPDDHAVLAELAEALLVMGDALAAMELLAPALRRSGENAGLHRLAGRAWSELREPAKALSAFHTAQAIEPDDRTAALIAALAAGEGSGLSSAYVRALFDRYAERFDADLLGTLGYAAPSLLRGALERVYGGAPAGLRVLDLGCGTGLMGVEARPFAAHLAGVDLSPRMVDKAQARALYDALSVGDAVAAMTVPTSARGWDLLVAADVLVYIGDLEPVFTAAAAALERGGRFAATVERLEDDGFALGPSRRYAHAASYIRRTAAAAGLEVLLLEECSPRREKRMPVPGLLFVLGKL